MKKAVFSNKRDPENRSEKTCICGGHNSSNPKSNLSHNATKTKLNRRIEAKSKSEYKRLITQTDDTFEVVCPMCGEPENSDSNCDFCGEFKEEE